ncbi:MAG TPA: peptide chain release factor N(5)-glutamine methyltransferase [Caldimonas sp.]|nr:peptide chain release factor N(5)-glutamine methyltransferase [Caldimonas sp.]
MTTVRDALADARARGIALLDAQLLLARVLATSRTALIAGDDRPLAPEEDDRWSSWLSRRADGEPVAYLLGEKEFHGLVLEVNADVLVPRPETELVVDWAAELIDAASPAAGVLPAPAVVDLGTGSGAIALAIKRLRPAARVIATDASTAALAVARRNAERIGLAIELVDGSWWAAVEARRFDIAVSNPPYVAAGDPHLAELRHEPVMALTPGGDGLDALRAIAVGATDHLFAGGWLIVEHGFDQGAAVRELLAEAGLAAIETRCDLAGLERATAGRLTRAA